MSYWIMIKYLLIYKTKIFPALGYNTKFVFVCISKKGIWIEVAIRNKSMYTFWPSWLVDESEKGNYNLAKKKQEKRRKTKRKRTLSNKRNIVCLSHTSPRLISFHKYTEVKMKSEWTNYWYSCDWNFFESDTALSCGVLPSTFDARCLRGKVE